MVYVQEPCDECGRVVPRNELQQISRRVVVGETSGTVRTYAKGGLGFTSGRTDYRIERLDLCQRCFADWMAVLRRQRRNRLLAGLLIISLIVLVGVVLAATINVAGVKQGPSGLANSTVDDATPTTSANAVETSNVTAAPPAHDEPVEATSQVSNTVQPTEATNVLNSEGLRQQGEAKPPALDKLPTPETTPNLSAAVARALSSGLPTPWQDGSISGEITVGEVRTYGAQACRSFAYTAAEMRSSVIIACRASDGIWRPTRRMFSRAAGQAGDY